MKQWLCSLLLAIGVVFLLGISHHSVRRHLHPQAAGDRSALNQNEFVSSWCRALWAASPTFAPNRAAPWEFFATQFGSLIADVVDDGPPWLDDRGPPAPNAGSQESVRWKVAGQVGQLSESTSQQDSAAPEPKFKTRVLQHALARSCKPLSKLPITGQLLVVRCAAPPPRACGSNN